jgi:hypothetical protein
MMPGFETEVPHELGQDAALVKLKGFLDQVKERFAKEISDVEGTWSDNVLSYELTTYGIKIDGTLTVEEDLVKMQGNLPFAAMIFKGKISDSIRAALEKAIAA